MNATLARAIGGVLGRDVVSLRELRGGDIHAAFRVETRDGPSVFAKSSPSAPHGMFTAEARGLDWLRETRTLRIPEVIAVADGEEAPRFLVLEFLDAAPRCAHFDEKLGHGLAALHRAGAPSFGLDHDNFIGSLAQRNHAHPSWAEFYRNERLLPLVERAARLLDQSTKQAFDRLFDRLPTIAASNEPPSRLHGDLWGGNLHEDDAGEPCLIDPAVYGGHREVDLAMMRLFGGFGPRVFAAYEEAWPLTSEHEARVALYQLYPLLVHLNLFGSSYAVGVRGALAATLRGA